MEPPPVSTPARLITSPRPVEIHTMSGEAVRANFLVDRIMLDHIAWVFTDLDRMALAGVAPAAGKTVDLDNERQTGTDFFLQRRELGVINTGGGGTVRVDGKEHKLDTHDGLYVGMGSKSVSFEGGGAKFFLLSCPAHREFPTTLIKKNEAKPLALGSQATANQRKIFQYIHPGGIKSCQLVMGFTELAEGSVWNTMPPHTHTRRTEIYYYFDLGQNVVSHFLGEPTNTRHVFVNNEQAVLSPSWSIHCGCGTAAYKFIWAMGGENQVFDDMDKVAPAELR